MNPLESVHYLLGIAWKGTNWLWGWSLFAEAYFWQFLLNQIKEGKTQEWMIVRSFRTAVAGAELLTGHTFLAWLEKMSEQDEKNQ